MFGSKKPKPIKEQYLESVKVGCQNIITDCQRGVTKAERSRDMWTKVHYALGIGATIFSITSSIFAFSDINKYVAGGFALVAALCSGVNTSIQPSDTAISANRAMARYRSLSRKVENFQNSVDYKNLSIAEINQCMDDFSEELTKIEDECFVLSTNSSQI